VTFAWRGSKRRPARVRGAAEAQGHGNAIVATGTRDLHPRDRESDQLSPTTEVDPSPPAPPVEPSSQDRENTPAPHADEVNMLRSKAPTHAAAFGAGARQKVRSAIMEAIGLVRLTLIGRAVTPGSSLVTCCCYQEARSRPLSLSSVHDAYVEVEQLPVQLLFRFSGQPFSSLTEAAPAHSLSCLRRCTDSLYLPPGAESFSSPALRNHPEDSSASSCGCEEIGVVHEIHPRTGYPGPHHSSYLPQAALPTCTFPRMTPTAPAFKYQERNGNTIRQLLNRS
jgi:hypothetical protein